MNLKSMANLVTSKVGRQLLIAQKHSPALMFGAGVVGVAATVVLACRATLRVEKVLDEHEDIITKIDHARETVPDYSEEDYKRDLVVTYTKTTIKFLRLYGPSLALGVTSIAALSGAHFVLNRRNVALTAAYAAVERGYAEYRRRVREELGDDKDREFRLGLVDREIVEETKTGPVVKTIKGAGTKNFSPYAVCFDERSSSFSVDPGYNGMFLRSQQNYANDLLQSRGHIFLNEVHDMLGLPRTKEGSVVGWVKGHGDDFVDFGILTSGDRYMGMEFVKGNERVVWLDFNVDGVIYDKI